MSFIEEFPVVVKVGTAHAGFGKMKIKDYSDFEDFRSVIALQREYVTAEPFIDWDYDFRIQKIGSHYRAFRRYSTNWKGKGLQQKDEDIPVTDTLKLWIDQASLAVGMGPDCICAMDGVHAKDGKEWLIELNDSAIGLVARHIQEDLAHIRDLVMLKLAEAYPLPSSSQQPDQSSESTPAPLQEQLETLKLEISRQRVQIDKLEKELENKSKSRGLFKRN
eukprot:TRINITY_DN1437_c0_g1_i5.p2 TRINITY_DN1437_c0_g1~~TRINITY_DN1437_c0_g1_i5.p2  ORF type:complete len:220 (+),score=46.42 TRINITY_DN1437_c0_g1_i5:512-1171(+)